MRIVAALGGNALLRRGEAMTAANQRRNVALAAGALAPLIRDGHELVITHGNGPQIGLIALQSDETIERDLFVGYIFHELLTEKERGGKAPDEPQGKTRPEHLA